MELGERLQLSQEQLRVAMTSKDHLKAWLEGTGRRWLILDSKELVDAIWDVAGGPGTLEGFIAVYRDHRALIPSGREVTEVNIAGDEVQVPVMKRETLEVEEMDRCIRHLIGLISEEDPAWALTNAPL